MVAMMINLRRPLEGAPGLLLLAALILFGATIGVSLALGFSWVKMNDSVANFLGGVVGAALGSALAVMGALYVQRLEARDRINAPVNNVRYHAQRALSGLRGLQGLFPGALSGKHEWKEWIANLYLNEVSDHVGRLPDSAGLSPEILELVERSQNGAPNAVEFIAKHGQNAVMNGDAETQEVCVASLEMAEQELQELLDELYARYPWAKPPAH